MKCINCKVPGACLLCGACWRLAIVTPAVVLLVEHGLKWLWP